MKCENLCVERQRAVRFDLTSTKYPCPFLSCTVRSLFIRVLILFLFVSFFLASSVNTVSMCSVHHMTQANSVIELKSRHIVRCLLCTNYVSSFLSQLKCISLVLRTTIRRLSSVSQFVLCSINLNYVPIVARLLPPS